MTDLQRALRAKQAKLTRLKSTLKFCKSMTEQIAHQDQIKETEDMISYMKGFDTSDQFVKDKE